MTVTIGINGFGRIGRCVLRALQVSKHDIKVAAINDLCDVRMSAHLLAHDSTHGAFAGKVATDGDDGLVIDGEKIAYTSIRDTASLPWADHSIDVLMECTGIFASKEKASAHLGAGAKKVLVSAPTAGADATVAYGINHGILGPGHKVVSNASCTTNCLAPVAKVLHDSVGIESGWMSTVHAYTNDQVTLDGPHKDYRRARAASESIIPTKTGAASAIGLVIPELEGKLSGIALRVPVRNVSLVDLTFIASKKTGVDEINDAMRNAAVTSLKGVLEVCEEPLVSSDFNGNPASSIFDALETSVDATGTHCKVLAWYDNEVGFSHRMLDTAVALHDAG